MGQLSSGAFDEATNDFDGYPCLVQSPFRSKTSVHSGLGIGVIDVPLLMLMMALSSLIVIYQASNDLNITASLASLVLR